MTAGRPIGNHIRNICKVLQRIGPAGTRKIYENLGDSDVNVENVGKYCSRAVGLGLLRVKLGDGTSRSFSVFTVVPDWEAIADRRKTTKLKAGPKPKQRHSKWTGVNSVFSMGTQAAQGDI